MTAPLHGSMFSQSGMELGRGEWETMDAIDYSIVGVPRHPGRCVVCHRDARLFEAVLLRAPDNKFAVAHERCAGVKTKNSVGGRGRVIVSGPDTLTVGGD